MAASFRVFVSAASNELASYRREVSRVLRRKGIEVRDQEHFRQGGGTLLEALRDYIRDCDAVICLVGDQCGAVGGAEHAAALGECPWFDRFRASTGASEASYTQWEFLLAKQFEKKTYVFTAAKGFASDNEPGAGDRADLQRNYRDWIKQIGEHREPLTTREKLIENVLVLPFPDLSRPKPNNLPYRSLGTLFKGREGFLGELETRLRPSTTEGTWSSMRPVAVHGTGGIGKTRAAIEYAWRNSADYSALLFVVADSPERLDANLAQLVGVLGIDGMEEATDDVRLRAVLDWLKAHPGWLAILDNVDTREAAEAIRRRLAELSHGDVLITTRVALWSGSVERLELDLLAPDDAANYLLEAADARHRAADDAEQVRQVAKRVGYLALGLEHAKAYVNALGVRFADYLAAWDRSEDAILATFDQDQIDYPREIVVAWQTSVDQLDKDARALLAVLSWFAPDPIPESVLDSLPEGTLAEDARKTLATLAKFSLVARQTVGEQRLFRLHPLVQATGRRRQRLSRKQVTDAPIRGLDAAVRTLKSAFDGDPDDVRDWPKLDSLAVHVDAVCQFVGSDVSSQSAVGMLLHRLGGLDLRKARFDAAELRFRRALEIDERIYSSNHPKVASDLCSLALTLRVTNRLAESEPLLRRAIEIEERVHGSEHPRVAVLLNNRAQLLRAMNRPAGVEALLRRAIEIDERAYGSDHPEVASFLNNLGTLYRDDGRFAEAEPILRRALDIDERANGEDHPAVARDLNNLASLLRRTDRLAEAEQMFRRALEINERAYGDDRDEVAENLNGLACLLQSVNRSEEAEPNMRRALRIAVANRGMEHPSVQSYCNNYLAIAGQLGLSPQEVVARMKAAGVPVELPPDGA